jgi:hypothetical protein
MISWIKLKCTHGGKVQISTAFEVLRSCRYCSYVIIQILTAALAPLTGLNITDAEVELDANVITLALAAYDEDTAYDAVYCDPDAYG